MTTETARSDFASAWIFSRQPEILVFAITSSSEMASSSKQDETVDPWC